MIRWQSRKNVMSANDMEDQ